MSASTAFCVLGRREPCDAHSARGPDTAAGARMDAGGAEGFSASTVAAASGSPPVDAVDGLTKAVDGAADPDGAADAAAVCGTAVSSCVTPLLLEAG